LAFQRVLDASGQYIKAGTAVSVKGKISVRDEKEPQLMVDAIEPLGGAAAAPREKAGEKTLWVRFPSRDHPGFKKLEHILVMFEGNERMIICIEDENKRLGAKCWIHDSLVRELKEMVGEKNVVVKQ